MVSNAVYNSGMGFSLAYASVTNTYAFEYLKYSVLPWFPFHNVSNIYLNKT
uniref:Uncharacterized protein n=1 Tax=Heterorhabditis bacteriophora TaxID=37862 RepID=A0A1I7WZB9_HETBA